MNVDLIHKPKFNKTPRVPICDHVIHIVKVGRLLHDS